MARAFPDADHTQPTHDEAPEPWDHPLLAGEALAASRARLAEAFGESVEVAFGAQVMGSGEGLVFVRSGELRTVRVSADGTWERGRDPRVINLCGPGSFAGLARAASFRNRAAGPPASATAQAYYAGVRWIASPSSSRTRGSKAGSRRWRPSP